MHSYASSSNRSKPLGLLAVCSVAAAIALQAVFDHLKIGPAWLLSPPTVGGSFGLLFLLVDRWAWRWPLLRKPGIIDTPIVEGTYEGLLRTSWDGSTREVRVKIDQTWTQIAIQFEVLAKKTSTSYSVAAAVETLGHTDARLTYTYRNQIRPGVADDDMKDHDGTAEVTISGAGAMSGRYYNFRGRQGTLELTRLE